jgi:hypothetical protein
MVHPQEDSVNVALLEKLKSLYAMLLGADREQVAALLAHFKAVLGSQDPRRIEETRLEVEAAAGRLEDSYVR